jgi:hypothetical protein
MKFTHYDLDICERGQKIEVTLKDNTANVLLLDNDNFQKYKKRRTYKYNGGHMTDTVSVLLVPYSGHWHVVVDRGGYAGTVQSSVRVIAV